MRRDYRVSVKVKVLFRREDDYFVAYCPALELSSYGKSTSEAKRAFEGAIDIFLSETARKGTLEKVLLDLGWALRQKPSCQYEPPTFRPTRLKSFASGHSESRIESTTVRIPCAPLRESLAYAGNH